MQISVTGRHMEVSDAIRTYAHEKVEGALAEFSRIENVHVILDVQKHRHIAELVVQGAQHVRMEASVESTDMYASINGVLDKIVTQLGRLREKVHEHKATKLADVERASTSTDTAL